MLSAAVFVFLWAQNVQAHLPRMARQNTEIKVERPEISKAYYGWLKGEPAVYRVESKTPFLLYLNLLSPRIEAARMDYSATIYKDGERFAQASADNSLWMIIYEPFANDYYAKGPELERRVDAGTYDIKVHNSGNSGNYALAIGKTENLSVGEFLRTMMILPAVKQEFFGKNWWDAYTNLIGLFALVLLVAVLMVLYFIISFSRRWHLKRNLDIQYAVQKSEC